MKQHTYVLPDSLYDWAISEGIIEPGVYIESHSMRTARYDQHELLWRLNAKLKSGETKVENP